MTEPMVDDALVEVTPEDREAYLALGIFHTCEDRMILAGWADESAEMQRIARHRLAGAAAGREEAAKVADASSTPPEGADAYWMAYTAASFDIATAIRQRGE